MTPILTFLAGLAIGAAAVYVAVFGWAWIGGDDYE